MNVRRHILASTLLLAAVLTSAAPSAQANDTSVGDLLGGSSVTITLGHSVWQSIRITPVPTSLNGYSVSGVCAAVASPDASSTAVEVCSVNGVGIGSRVSLPGEASAATTLVTAFRNTWISACVQASAEFVENISGPASMTNPQHCYPVFLP